MRETRIAQASIFENYSEHDFGTRLKTLSQLLDSHPQILTILEKDLLTQACNPSGRSGMTVESIFRCLLLKQLLGVSYEQLAFHLSDSTSYRTFARLPYKSMPKKSCLQSTIRTIKPETLEVVHHVLTTDWLDQGVLSLDKLRIDSTVVASSIAPPNDSQLLNDGVRVISRLLAKSREAIGTRIRFTDKRKTARSLAFRIFHAKKAGKDVLYRELLKVARVVLKQAERGLREMSQDTQPSISQRKWRRDLDHYCDLTKKIMQQTQARVIDQVSVPTADKIVSLFEEHTDIIVKGFRDVQYGHKINLCTEKTGFITYLSIEDGNPSDKEKFLPVLQAHRQNLGQLPHSVVADGGYASKENVTKGRALGVQHVVFHKRVGISYLAMGVKSKTFKRLRDFRAGIEGNISELKRAFGVGKATWKGHEGFKAFVWSSVITYNLVRLARLQSG